jgi:predicted transcriptional regulator
MAREVMARKKTPTLTDTELRLMDVIWRNGEATVKDVLDGLPGKDSPAYNTVLTILRILEQKGYLKHVKRGRAHVYQPLITRESAQRKVVRHIVKNFFDNSAELLMLNILENEELSPEDLRKLHSMVDEAEKERS